MSPGAQVLATPGALTSSPLGMARAHLCTHLMVNLCNQALFDLSIS